MRHHVALRDSYIMLVHNLSSQKVIQLSVFGIRMERDFRVFLCPRRGSQFHISISRHTQKQ